MLSYWLLLSELSHPVRMWFHRATLGIWLTGEVQGSFMACLGAVPWFGDVTADVAICPYTGNPFLEVFKDAAGPG